MTPSVGEDLEDWDLCALPTASHGSTAPPESSLIVTESTKRTHDPAVLSLEIGPREIKHRLYPGARTRTSMTLFLRASNWNQPPRPPAGEQVSTAGPSAQRVGVCSKTTHLLTRATMWMNLKV